MNYPHTWPDGTLKTVHNAFTWAGQPSIIPREPQHGKRGPKKSSRAPMAFGTPGGVMSGLSPNGDERIRKISPPSHIVRPPNHNGAYSKTHPSPTK